MRLPTEDEVFDDVQTILSSLISHFRAWRKLTISWPTVDVSASYVYQIVLIWSEQIIVLDIRSRHQLFSSERRL